MNTVSQYTLQGFVRHMVQVRVKAGMSTKDAAAEVARELNSWGVQVVRSDMDNRVGQDRLRKVMAQDVRRANERAWVPAYGTKVWA